MRGSSAYFHSLKGRLRIKIVQVKGSPARAAELEGCLLRIGGIKYVKANPITGNVLTLYDHDRIGQAEIIHALQSSGYFTENGNTRNILGTETSDEYRNSSEELINRLLWHLAQVMVKIAFQSLISALI